MKTRATRKKAVGKVVKPRRPAALDPEKLRSSVAAIVEVAALWEKGLLDGQPDEAREHHLRLLRQVAEAGHQHWDRTPVGRAAGQVLRLSDVHFVMLRTLVAREIWLDKEAGRSDEDMVRMIQGVLQRFWYMSVSAAEIQGALKALRADIRNRKRWEKEEGGPVTAAGKLIARVTGASHDRALSARRMLPRAARGADASYELERIARLIRPQTAEAARIVYGYLLELMGCPPSMGKGVADLIIRDVRRLRQHRTMATGVMELLVLQEDIDAEGYFFRVPIGEDFFEESESTARADEERAT